MTEHYLNLNLNIYFTKERVPYKDSNHRSRAFSVHAQCGRWLAKCDKNGRCEVKILALYQFICILVVIYHEVINNTITTFSTIKNAKDEQLIILSYTCYTCSRYNIMCE